MNRDIREVHIGPSRWFCTIMGEGPELLLVHGLAASSHSWSGVQDVLQKSCRVLCVDLPGHGRSHQGGAQLSLPFLSRSLEELLRRLEFEPRVMVGHSAGSAIVAQLACDRTSPPAALVSFNGAFFPFGGSLYPLHRGLARWMDRRPRAARLISGWARRGRNVQRTLQETGSDLAPEAVARYESLASSPRHVGAALSMMAHWDLDPLLRSLPSLSSRLLAVAGRADRAVAPTESARIAALVPHGRFAQMRGGHLAHEEYPVEAAQFILQELDA